MWRSPAVTPFRTMPGATAASFLQLEIGISHRPSAAYAQCERNEPCDYKYDQYRFLHVF